MEEYKKRYLKDFLLLSSASLKKCYELVQRNETKLRNCYAVPVELDSKDFVKMVLLDAVFILMTILYSTLLLENMPMDQKRIFEKPVMIYDIKYDLVLLENQLPFFIIEELYKLSNIYNNWKIRGFSESFPIEEFYQLREETALITLLIASFDNLSIMDIKKLLRHPPTKAEHLLGLLRSCLKPKDWNPKRKSTCSFTIPSIKELNQAGVKFKVRENGNLFDIEFNNGVLEIPTIQVHGYTELLFRNLIAFELSNNLDLLCIDYFRMMQKFTMDSEDAEVLIRNKIIENRLSDAQAISTMYHKLSLGFVFEPASFGYADVIRDLNAYYAVRWNRWKAT